MTKPSSSTIGSELRAFERSLPMALMRAREAVMLRFRPILAAHGITEQQWRVLRALDDRDATVSIGELADITFLLGPSLSRMLASLEQRELIERRTDADDARRTGISISAQGRALVEAIAPESEAAYGRIETQISADDLARLYELLGRVAAID